MRNYGAPRALRKPETAVIRPPGPS
jgi:hypothetical protein